MASILVVEDRAGTHELLRSALVIAGHDVVVSGPAFPSGRYDLAVVDSTSAASVVAEVTRRASRVVLYTDAPATETDTRAGITGYLLRGQSARALVEQVHRLLRS